WTPWGGEMANHTDKSLIQIKVLNSSKGPAVQALRAQTDKKRYESEMKKVVLGQPNLSLRQGIATDILATPEGVQGIVTLTGERYLSRAVVVAKGTFFEREDRHRRGGISRGTDGRVPCHPSL
ncbi:tRNA uridine 5-carboxymethylaminomethyl modification enzyme, partial [Candidatus Hakubella thermalkaliphila]